jgi:hypothetical protein
MLKITLRHPIFHSILISGLLFILCSCAAPFKPIIFDPKTGLAPTFVKVENEDILVFKPIKGLSNAKFIYLNVFDGVSRKNEDAYAKFLINSMREIGIKNKFMSKRELSMFIIQNGLSDQITNLSDFISLNKLAKIVGPYLIIETAIYPVSDVVFRCEFSIVEPYSGSQFLEINRTRTNWMDFDTEISYPIINVLKHWYEESKKLDSDKNLEKEQPIVSGEVPSI